MTIPDEAVQAAARELCRFGTSFSTIEASKSWVDEKWPRFKEEATRALTAALPFLQGVKMEPWGWVIPRGGNKKPVILEASKFDQASAAAEADIHDLGYFPIYTQSAPDTSKELCQKLEAGFKRGIEAAAKIIESSVEGVIMSGSQRGKRVLASRVDGDLSGLGYAAAIRALSSQPVADGPERGKFYHKHWGLSKLLEARNGGLVDHSGGEAWRYEYTSKDENGEYDMLYRHNVNASVPARLPTSPGASE